MSRVLYTRGGALGDFILALPVLDALLSGGDDVDVACVGRYAALLPRVGRAPRRVWDLERVESTWMFGGTAPEPYVRAYAFNPTLAEGLRAAGIPEVVERSPVPPPGVPAWRHFGAGGLPRLRGGGTPVVSPRLVVISPGSGGQAKRAPIPFWCAVDAGIRAGCREAEIVWVAGPLEAGESWPVAPLRLDLLDTVDLAARAACWLGPDSGPSHLAAAAMRGARGIDEVPVGVLYSVTDPTVWAPPGARAFVAGEDAGAVVEQVVATARGWLAE